MQYVLRTACLSLLLAVAMPAQSFDLVVYGGTAGGVMTAVAAAREGLHVALLEPGQHVGGMVSSGLGFTDYGRKEVIGGYALEFYWRLGRYYQMNRFGQDIAWLHEPHVAEQIFREMLAEAGVTVLYNQQLRTHGVIKNGTRITSVAMESGATFTAPVFVDSSYEGDLMAQAGVHYTWGRESAAQYGEPLAGVRGVTPFHQFTVDIPAYDAIRHLLPEIAAGAPGETGAADRLVQAYNFRLCLCDDAGRVPIAMPPGYHASRYALLGRLIAARQAKEGAVPALGTLLKLDRLPNGKTDVNNNGAFSTDFIGGSWDYPEATPAQRQSIWQAHKDYQQGLLYFLAHDAGVPTVLQQEMQRWGLCRDEFTDNDNWPRQLYIREARRMLGLYVARQADLQTDLTKPDAIGMGSYNSDSHNVRRYVDARGFVRNEGDMQVAVQPYQIPYRSMVPQRADAQNLLVPVAFSASHVAYSSMRMEPQYMIIGQAAGVAAAMAVQAKLAVQDVDAAALSARLEAQGAILRYEPSRQQAALQIIKKRAAQH